MVSTRRCTLLAHSALAHVCGVCFEGDLEVATNLNSVDLILYMTLT
jgi:hypothetical protein